MADQTGQGKGPAFPELELDIAPPKPVKDEVEEEEPDHEMSLELVMPPVSRHAPVVAPSGSPPAAGSGLSLGAAGPSSPPASLSVPAAPSSGRGGASFGPPGPPGAPAPSFGPPASWSAPPASHVPGRPAGGIPTATDPPPSAAAALVARARTAAQDPGAVARNVAEVGNRTSTALVMLGGAIMLTLLDVVYARVTGEKFSLGPVRLIWISVPLALIGAGVLGWRVLKEHGHE